MIIICPCSTRARAPSHRHSKSGKAAVSCRPNTTRAPPPRVQNMVRLPIVVPLRPAHHEFVQVRRRRHPPGTARVPGHLSGLLAERQQESATGTRLLSCERRAESLRGSRRWGFSWRRVRRVSSDTPAVDIAGMPGPRMGRAAILALSATWGDGAPDVLAPPSPHASGRAQGSERPGLRPRLAAGGRP